MLSTVGLRRTRNTLGRIANLGLEGTPGLVGLVSGTALTSVAILLVNLGSGVAQARGLGPEGRGDLAVAMLWPTLIAGVGGLGIQEAVAYRTSLVQCGRSPVLATALMIGVGQTLLLALLGWLLLPVVLHGKPPQLLDDTRFYLWTLPLFPLTLYPTAFFQGRLALKSFNLARFCVNAASTAPLLALWILHAMTVRAALSASLAAMAATALLCLGILLRRRDVEWRPTPHLGPWLLWFGSRLHIGNVATILTQRLDLLVLSLLVPTASVGTYAVATSAGMVASLLPTAASLVLYPAFARQTRAALPAALARFLLAGILLTLIAGPMLAGLLPVAVPVIFGQGFRGAVPLTTILSLGYLVRGWNLMLCSVVRGAARPFTASICQAVELAVLAGLLLVFVPRFGTIGAAAAVLVGAALSLLSLMTAAFVSTRLSVRELFGLWMVDVRRLRHAAWGSTVAVGDLDS